jgi:ABC-type multidrug transport system fused ATPase/permease subunit
MITQRLSTIKNADRIIVLDNGKLKEIGTHEELLGLNGLYSQIYMTQFA